MKKYEKRKEEKNLKKRKKKGKYEKHEKTEKTKKKKGRTRRKKQRKKKAIIKGRRFCELPARINPKGPPNGLQTCRSHWLREHPAFQDTLSSNKFAKIVKKEKESRSAVPRVLKK